jgi:hypothetical protein
MAKLANRVMEDLTGVSARWLSGAAPWFEKLIRAAQDPAVSDAEFEQLIVRAKASIPDELARHLKPQVVADALEAAMGASMVNGAVAGYLGRRPRRR